MSYNDKIKFMDFTKKVIGWPFINDLLYYIIYRTVIYKFFPIVHVICDNELLINKYFIKLTNFILLPYDIVSD